MDILWSLGLLLVVALAFNHMAGGRASNVLRPVTNISSNVLTSVFRSVLGVVGAIFRLGAGALKLPKSGSTNKGVESGSGPPPPRWK